MEMDRKSKILIIILVICMAISIWFTYKRAFIDRNFITVDLSEGQY